MKGKAGRVAAWTAGTLLAAGATGVASHEGIEFTKLGEDAWLEPTTGMVLKKSVWSKRRCLLYRPGGGGYIRIGRPCEEAVEKIEAHGGKRE